MQSNLKTLEEIIDSDPSLKTLIRSPFDSEKLDYQVDITIGALKVALAYWLNQSF